MPFPRQARRNAFILALGLVVPLFALSTLFFFKSSGLKRAVADPAIYAAQSSPQVAAQIGLPIQPGWPIHGRILSKDGEGNADLQIPLTGGRGQGILAEWAQQNHGKWRLCSLDFQSEGQATLHLVEAATTACEAE